MARMSCVAAPFGSASGTLITGAPIAFAAHIGASYPGSAITSGLFLSQNASTV